MKALGDAPALLSDSTLPVNFCKCGLALAEKFADYFGDQIHIVHDVRVELIRNPWKITALDEFLKIWPRTAVIHVSETIREELSDIQKINRRNFIHDNEDIGEYATVFHARDALKVDGTKFTILTDDGDGKMLARREGLVVSDTPSLVIEMAVAQHLSEQEACAVWNAALPRKEAAFWERLEEDRKNLAP